jgi:hypothetical protein
MSFERHRGPQADKNACYKDQPEMFFNKLAYFHLYYTSASGEMIVYPVGKYQEFWFLRIILYKFFLNSPEV